MWHHSSSGPHLPPMLAPVVDFAPGEVLLGCWKAIAWRPTPDGQYRTHLWGESTPNAGRGRLVLTNDRLRYWHVHKTTDKLEAFEVRPRPDQEIPLGLVIKVAVHAQRGTIDRMLVLRSFHRVGEVGGVVQTDGRWSDRFFLVNGQEKIQEVYDRIYGAAQVAAAQLMHQVLAQRGAADPDPRVEPEEDGPIRFHAQDDP